MKRALAFVLSLAIGAMPLAASARGFAGGGGGARGGGGGGARGGGGGFNLGGETRPAPVQRPAQPPPRPPSNGGNRPPPPSGGGGYRPPPNGGGTRPPPPNGGGYRPPPNGGGYRPPPPPPNGGGGYRPPNGGGNGYRPPPPPPPPPNYYRPPGSNNYGYYSGYHGPRTVVVNPVYVGPAWGWNRGVAWYPATTYWGGGFWGAMAIGVTSAAVFGAFVNSSNQATTSYQVEQNSPGATLLKNYGLTQVPCGPPELVVIFGPNDSVICANPNNTVAAGQYDLDAQQLSIIAR